MLSWQVNHVKNNLGQLVNNTDCTEKLKTFLLFQEIVHKNELDELVGQNSKRIFIKNFHPNILVFFAF